jgi:hypothetical protein
MTMIKIKFILLENKNKVLRRSQKSDRMERWMRFKVRKEENVIKIVTLYLFNQWFSLKVLNHNI